MQNKWENYFKDNEEAADVFKADEERMWRNINSELNSSKFSLKKVLVAVVAAASIIIAISMIVRHEMMMQMQLESLAAINEELAEKEHDYINQVSLKWNEYKALSSSENDVTPLLMEELQLLDTIYQKGLSDIKDHGYNERAVVIMLNTYEKRLRIIERLINEKRKQERDENKSNHIHI